MALPPGPRFALPTLLGYLRDPVRTTLATFERYGDPHTLSAMGTRLVTTGDPTLIRAILAADPAGYDAFGAKQMAPAIGGNSIMLLDGERHRAARKLQSPPFHGSRMRAFAALMQRIARAEAASWPAGAPFAMQRATQSISLRIILSAVLGAADGEAAATLERLLVELIAALRPSLLLMGALQGRWYPPWARFLRRRAAVERWLLDEIRARRAAAEPRHDILSALVSARYDDGAPMDDREVFESMMTLVVAGHETTALALAWALWLLHRHPDVRDRLEAELRTVDDPAELATLPWLDAVCQETLRLRPIAASIARVLTRPMTLGGWELPAGTAVNPSLIALHRRPEQFPEPDAFRPERFVGKSFAPHEFMPFGGGHRRCLGAAFAMFEMKIVLGTILQSRRLELVDDGEVEMAVRNTVLGPARPLRFVASAATRPAA